MVSVTVSESAKRDVRALLSHLTEVAGFAVAARYAGEFKAVYRGLAQFPASGAARPALGRFVRLKIVYPYVLFYEFDGFAVVALRVLHGRQDSYKVPIRGDF